MKLFSLLPLFTAGQMDFSNMSADQVGPMMQTFLPMFKQFYNKMDHEQSMADFKKDDNGMFKQYFKFCDVGGDGLLTKEDDTACKAQMQEIIMNRVRSMGVDIPEGSMEQAKPFMDMIDAMGEQMFNEIIDENGDGAASLEEIEMGGYCLIRASAQMMIQMMDRNGDGKLAKNEIGGMDLDSMLAQADMSAVKQYVPDIEKLIKKAKRVIKKADLDHDKAYDDRELAKVMLDMTDLMIKRIFKN